MPIWPILLRAVAVPARGEVDELVLARARHGDQDAFAAIVGHYDHRLRALAFRLLGDRDRMDDVLQEAYVKAFRALPRFKGASALGTWLYRITYNACLDDLRRRPAVAPVTYDADRAASIADRRLGPAEVVVERDDLAAALDRLPTDQRAAVMLVDAYGLDYAEAAEVLGVRAGTIGSRFEPGTRCIANSARQQAGGAMIDRDERLGYALRALDVPHHGPEFYAHLAQRLNQEPARGGREGPHRGWQGPMLVILALAAVVLALLVSSSMFAEGRTPVVNEAGPRTTLPQTPPTIAPSAPAIPAAPAVPAPEPAAPPLAPSAPATSAPGIPARAISTTAVSAQVMPGAETSPVIFAVATLAAPQAPSAQAPSAQAPSVPVPSAQAPSAPVPSAQAPSDFDLAAPVPTATIMALPLPVPPTSNPPLPVLPISVPPITIGPITVGPIFVDPIVVGPIFVDPIVVDPISVGPISVGPISVGPISVGPISMNDVPAAGDGAAMDDRSTPAPMAEPEAGE